MIDKHFGDFIILCDICNEESEESFDTFQDALDAKKELGWYSEKRSKGWFDICPNCKEVLDKED